MKIAFFTENNFKGKVSRQLAGRTDTAWMATLCADHYSLSDTLTDTYDLGIIIVPKNSPTTSFLFLEKNKEKCNSWATMQEANQTYWQNGPIIEQINYITFLISCDIIFCHNERDKSYYQGLIPGKKVEVLSSLMLEDAIPESITGSDNRSGCMVGGNWTEWYSGQDSYFIAQEFGEQIYAPSMGRKHPDEDLIQGINYLPYLDWSRWIEELSKRKYGVHLMRTYAAGTFSLNCARLGIPCIGWNFMDTQKLCFPELSFEEGDMVSARKAAQNLKTNELFYKHCSEYAKKAYEEHFSEKVFMEKFNSYFLNN